MTTSIIRGDRLMPAAQEAWGALHQKSDSQNPFTHPAWCTTWAQFYAPDRLRLLTDFDDDGDLRAILPLAATGRSGRHWATAGSPFADFGDPLVAGELQPGETVAQMLAETREQWNSVALGGLSESVVGDLATAGHRHGLNVRIIGTEICPRVAAPPSKPWLESLSQTRRRRIAVARRMVGERLAAVFRVAETPETIPAAVWRCEKLRLQSWWQRNRLGQLPSAVRTSQHSRFLVAACTRLAEHGCAAVVELTAGERLLAAAVLLHSGGSTLLAMKATDTRLGTRFSPGLVLDAFIMDRAASRGSGIVEFGRGDEPYKFTLGAQPALRYHVLVVQGAAYGARLRFDAQRRLAELEYAWRMRHSA
jgi:CelD/BcsL family acetyltransferase involved in cellulose biosynthesis